MKFLVLLRSKCNFFQHKLHKVLNTIMYYYFSPPDVMETEIFKQRWVISRKYRQAYKTIFIEHQSAETYPQKRQLGLK